MDFNRRICAEIPHLRRYARALCGDTDQADDLVQDCLERAMRKRHLWRPAGRLRAWLFRVLYRLFLNNRDAARNRREVLRAQPGDEQAVHAAVGEAQVYCFEVLAAVDRLPDHQRAALLLIALEAPGYREAAWMLGIRVGTLRSRIARAREQVRTQLETDRATAAQALRRVK